MSKNITITKEQYDEYQELLKFKEEIAEKIKPMDLCMTELRIATFGIELTKEWAGDFIKTSENLDNCYNEFKKIIK